MAITEEEAVLLGMIILITLRQNSDIVFFCTDRKLRDALKSTIKNYDLFTETD